MRDTNAQHVQRREKPTEVIAIIIIKMVQGDAYIFYAYTSWRHHMNVAVLMTCVFLSSIFSCPNGATR